MISVLLAVHMKALVHEAIDSVLAQTRSDIQLVVADSGVWRQRTDDASSKMRDIHGYYRAQVEWRFTDEPPDLRQHKCPIGWVTNRAFREGWLRGSYIATLYDDDLWYPTFAEKMAGYLDGHPEALAVWCSQDRVHMYADGRTTKVGVIRADAPKRGNWDNAVDGGQVMFRREALGLIGDPWLTEDPADAVCRHSDGMFLEKLGAAAGGVPNIPDVLCANRKTPLSAYSPT